MTLAKKHLMKRGAVVMVGYFVSFIGAALLVDRIHPEGAALWLMAALPVLPILVVMYLMGLYLREETDEYHRDLVVRCLLWGAAGAVATSMFAGFLRLFGWKGQLPPFCDFFVFALFMMVAKVTYKVANRAPAAE